MQTVLSTELEKLLTIKETAAANEITHIGKISEWRGEWIRTEPPAKLQLSHSVSKRKTFSFSC